MARKTISFRIFLHDQLVDTRSFDHDVIKLGRLASSHLRLDHDAIARMHAVIEVGQDGHPRLVDLGSQSGTRHNGNLIERSAALRSGDKLELGPYRLEIAIADARPAGSRALASAPIARPPVEQAAPQIAVDLGKIEDPTEQVAEVVASYGRSILDVAHVGQTRASKRSAVPLLALGGVLMAGGLGLFGYEVAQPWDEYTVAVAEAQKFHREAPEAPGLQTGSLGLVLALLGLVPLLAGGLRLREQPLDAYLIGEGDEAHFKVSGANLQDPGATPLVERHAGGYALAFSPAMSGAVELGGQQLSLADLVASGRAMARDGGYVYPLPTSARAEVEHGDIRFQVSVVNRGAVVAGRGEVDWPFWGYFGGTATIATAFYLLMRSMPDDSLALQLDDDRGAPRYAAYFHQADDKPKIEEAEPTPELVESDQRPNGGKAGARASGPEGKMGNPSSKSPSGAYQMKGPKSATPQIARTFDPTAAAANAGILGIIAAQDSHFLASPTGGAFAVGNDDEDLWGNVVGLQAGEAYGTGGLGLVGTGRSGGGNASNAIGLGNTGLIGHGTGTDGTGYGPGGGEGVVGFNTKKTKVPVVQPTTAKITGDVDKDLIRRIVRAHINEVRSCYNAGLTRDPTLDGRVTIQFSIVGSGKVASSVVQENTTRDSQVANCIAKAVKRWKFPRVNSGGTALVSYPFRLSSR
ncbi:MAG: AgmX/PglI C-terminal domain-containing protein [Enhygromyxa sp.]